MNTEAAHEIVVAASAGRRVLVVADSRWAIADAIEDLADVAAGADIHRQLGREEFRFDSGGVITFRVFSTRNADRLDNQHADIVVLTGDVENEYPTVLDEAQRIIGDSVTGEIRRA